MPAAPCTVLVTRQKWLPSVAYNLIAPQVVQNLIADQMLLQEAERMGFHVTEEERADLLRANLPYLHADPYICGA